MKEIISLSSWLCGLLTNFVCHAFLQPTAGGKGYGLHGSQAFPLPVDQHNFVATAQSVNTPIHNHGKAKVSICLHFDSRMGIKSSGVDNGASDARILIKVISTPTDGHVPLTELLDT